MKSFEAYSVLSLGLMEIEKKFVEILIVNLLFDNLSILFP